MLLLKGIALQSEVPSVSNHQLATQLFLQLFLLLVSVKFVGRLARYIGQPQVVGEMIAGVLLGPSFLGLFFPETRTLFFPQQSIPVLYSMGQVGLGLYMFMIGMEFDYHLVKTRAKVAVGVSIAGILAPFLLGAAIGLSYAGNGELFPVEINPWEAALFCGAALSITAFPMLARIIFENGISGTPVGALSLSAGAFNDLLAWCILAIVLASASGDPRVALIAIGGGIGFSAIVYLFLRPALKRIAEGFERDPEYRAPALAWVFIFFCASAWMTDAVGIYSVFGSFILGMAIPRKKISLELQAVLEPITTYLFLPIFFVYSGLNTKLFLVSDPKMFLVTMLFLAAASIGKGVACGATAYAFGEKARDSLAIGALMNARGLMELILLNIALERNIITQATFTSLVIVAILTTFLATPLFKLSKVNEVEERQKIPLSDIPSAVNF